MTYVRIAAVVTLLVFLWPLATPAGPAYARMLVHQRAWIAEGLIGMGVLLVWLLRRLAEVVFLRASGRRLRALVER